MKTSVVIDGEEGVLLINEHWIKYLPMLFLLITSWFLYSICLALSLSIRDTSHIGFMVAIITGHIILLAFHHAAFYNYFCASSRRTLVSSRRILMSEQHPWFSDDISDTPIWRIRSVEVHQKGILQHVLGYGSFVFNRGELPTIKRAPHPHDTHAQIIPYIQGMQPAIEKRYHATQVNRTPSLSSV